MQIFKPLKKFKKAKRLPRSMYGWLVAAVADARRLEQMPGFELDMSTFNSMSGERNVWGDMVKPHTCLVCLGGACIVGRGLIAPGKGIGPISGRAATLAYALEYVRSGHIRKAVDKLFDAGLISRKPSQRAIAEATNIIKRSYKGVFRERATWSAYLAAAEAVRQHARKGE